MNRENVKFSTGTYYCQQDWDREINIVGFIGGKAICQGWKISYETIRTDDHGNEFIQIEHRTYPAYCKI